MLPHGAGAVLHEVGGLQIGNVELDGKRVFAVSAALSYCFGVVPAKGRATGDGAGSPETVASAAEASA